MRRSSYKRLRKKRVLIGLVILVTVITLVPSALTALGTSLIVEDGLQHARAIVVFGGHLPFRAMEAAALYRQGWALEIWLTRGGVHPEDLALERLGIERTPEHVYSRQVLIRLGVPERAIRLLDGKTQNTAEEVQAVAKELYASGGERVILVTSKYHARRVKYVWRRLVGSRPEAIIRYTSNDPFQPTEWWRNTTDAMSVSREWFGLLNAWAGFPIKSEISKPNDGHTFANNNVERERAP
jgi:uncharacterized SAM-binding protein YcdF (DUF218 family)